jgi:AcrR family transcriptional regulator
LAATEGLRERKKRETHETIVRTAMRLFARRGFDAVTVADIARAAKVSEKTVFNYFPTKEDLVFSARANRTAALVAAIQARPRDESLVAVFRRWTNAFLDQVEHGSVDDVLAVPRLVMQSEALRNRLFLGWEREAAALTPAIAEEARSLPGDVTPAVVARTLAWTHRLVFRSALNRLLAGEDQATVAAALRIEATRAYDVLEGGLGAYGVSADGGA